MELQKWRLPMQWQCQPTLEFDKNRNFLRSRCRKKLEDGSRRYVMGSLCVQTFRNATAQVNRCRWLYAERQRSVSVRHLSFDDSIVFNSTHAKRCQGQHPTGIRLPAGITCRTGRKMTCSACKTSSPDHASNHRAAMNTGRACVISMFFYFLL